MDDAAFKARLARLRSHRVSGGRDVSLGGMLLEQRKRVRRTSRANQSLDETWRRLVPPRIAEQSRVLSLARGTLTVRVADEGVRFEADRWLRAGGMSALIAAAPATLVRVRFIPAGSR